MVWSHACLSACRRSLGLWAGLHSHGCRNMLIHGVGWATHSWWINTLQGVSSLSFPKFHHFSQDWQNTSSNCSKIMLALIICLILAILIGVQEDLLVVYLAFLGWLIILNTFSYINWLFAYDQKIRLYLAFLGLCRILYSWSESCPGYVFPNNLPICSLPSYCLDTMW